MSKAEKLLTKAKENPEGLTFQELKNLLVRYGWCKVRHKGTSHQQWRTPDGKRVIPMKDDHGKAAKYHVELFLKFTEGI